MHKWYRLLSLGVLLLLSVSLAVAQPQELPLGTTLPLQDHAIQHVDGTQTTIGGLTGANGTVFIFWSNNCRWSDSYEARVLALHEKAAEHSIALVLINANDPEAFPQEAASVGLSKNYPMPYVMDAGSAFAQAVGAFRTPHVFAFDALKTLVYTGTIDDSPGDPENVQKTYLQDVIRQLSEGTNPNVTPTKAFGCRIKFQGVGG